MEETRRPHPMPPPAEKGGGGDGGKPAAAPEAGGRVMKHSRKQRKGKTPCAYCGNPFQRKAHRVGMETMSLIMRNGGWPPVPRTQHYCSANCRKRAAVARKRTAAVAPPSRLVERKRVVIGGRVAYIAGLANENSPIPVQCSECGKVGEWNGRGRPPKYCSAKCRTAFSRKNKTDESIAAWRKGRK